jgi:hypothetical protein
MTGSRSSSQSLTAEYTRPWRARAKVTSAASLGRPTGSLYQVALVGALGGAGGNTEEP